MLASSLYAKFDCLVAHHNVSLLATAHDYETSDLRQGSRWEYLEGQPPIVNAPSWL